MRQAHKNQLISRNKIEFVTVFRIVIIYIFVFFLLTFLLIANSVKAKFMTLLLTSIQN